MLTLEPMFVTIEKEKKVLNNISREERAMYDNHYLTQKIRQYCAARGWYGVDLRGPEWDTEVAENDPRRTTFTFPPATVDQLQETETLLGFALPPFLRILYAEVANGGFGPAYGLRGAVGGFADATGTIVHQYQGLCEGRSLLDFDLEAEIAQKHGEIVVPFDQWLRGLFSLCEWGCAIQICQNSATGRLYRVEPSGDGYHITHEAESLEEWLERWMHAELYTQSRQ
jgi:hypothetical protein